MLCRRVLVRRPDARLIIPSVQSSPADWTSLLHSSPRLAIRTRRAGADIHLSVYVDSLRISRLVPTPQTPEAGRINLRWCRNSHGLALLTPCSLGPEQRFALCRAENPTRTESPQVRGREFYGATPPREEVSLCSTHTRGRTEIGL